MSLQGFGVWRMAITAKLHHELYKLNKITICHLQIKKSPLNESNISNLQRQMQINADKNKSQ